MIRFVITVWVSFLAGLAAAGAFLAVSEPFDSRFVDALVAVVVFSAASFAAVLVTRSITAWLSQATPTLATNPTTETAASVH